MAVSKRTRFEVLKRDNYTCRYCRSTEAELTIDHVLPVALGGTDEPDNLVAACRDCNAGKSSTGPSEGVVADVSDEQMRWADAMKRAAEVRAERQAEIDAYVDQFDERWGRLWSVPRDYESTLEALFKSGLPVDLMLRCVDITINARGVYSRFSYFCGVAWRHVNELQEIARELIDEQKESESGTD